MNCIICNSETEFFFEKTWTNEFKPLLESAQFYKCKSCGFTFSKTLYDMDFQKWLSLNEKFHYYIEDSNNPKIGNQPPYLEQALMLNILIKNNVVNKESMMDYAAGVGTLSQIMKTYFDIDLPIYDPYIKSKSNDLRYLLRSDFTKKDFVFCSALFEHITKREHLNEINNLVSNTGVLVIHTVICENIPKDSNWFYINPPVHCSLFTNKSMDLFMKQFNYEVSIYCPSAKSWVLFKKDSKNLFEFVDLINKLSQTNYLYIKKGFVDYWKGF